MAGETLCDMTIAANLITLEAMVDVTKIVAGAVYKLSAKIGSSCDDIKGEVASDESAVFRPDTVASIDATFPDIGAVAGIVVSAPLSVAEMVIALNNQSSTYVFYEVDSSTIMVFAPASGTTYNGDVVTLVTKNSIGITLGTITLTLAGGIDTVECPPFIPNVNNYKETEDGEIKFTEDAEVKIIE
jgi:uncharacterized cupredoxin-like copper-binding protein